ncbi:Os09g0538450 [Oryza sativa Japonica Group]|uniref:Os09g0538450 protein n=4 Tax=Oryza TaxID=4527 RepID=C7J6Z7_ORYSJ|nr:hypothetical protein OsI_32197 [Oryza sativa Indica Group]KAB8111518.1 hypothetical protein EE612_049200 [Oryza sativa]BAH94687.1 Os09g0538450 [Oryza sativa Japonica Group]BAT09174.1 Os09g0538450 [Oryza sativa Japonica Group]|eukprot:NP_001175959.1 Os09g0538450 [Oryza sativa Japonica Group]
MYSSSSLSCARERWWRMGDGPVWCLTKCRSAARHGEVGASSLYAPIILGSGQQAMSASYASTAAGLMGVWVESGCLSSCGANVSWFNCTGVRSRNPLSSFPFLKFWFLV